jgi:serine/threonine protein kinase/tetratricopeptide (TPR) repeat protein
MAATQDNNQEQRFKEAFRQFVEAQLFGRKPDIEELVKNYPEFEDQIRQKLERFRKVDSLFGSIVRADESDFDDPSAGQDLVGRKIGNYKIIEMVGEGGMGIVYLAEQQGSIRRRVALKVIKPGMDSKRVLARFEVERQALALLDHPNIAQVYDAGTTVNGRPYFVMEYVKGLPVTEYCDHHMLSIEERLRLFQQVCQAVHHAHQKGIIHRDIKPSNILVSEENDRPIPKIIDFGVAKAIAQPLTERTLYTEQGQLFGTPEYMSPEQADMAGEDIDTRSDIYSLGVLLYVLLTGVLPFDSATFREGGIDHIRKVIRETDPKTPSTRLTSLGDEAKEVAQKRSTEVGTLAKRLYKELEWIPLMAMRKDRTRRYRSASEFSDDIENYLKGVPLIAGPLGTIYRLKKFVRRNRALVGGALAVLVVSLIGTVVSIIFAIGQARTRAEMQEVSDFLRHSVLESLDPFKVGGREITIRSVLDTASKSLEGEFTGTPLAEAGIRYTIGNAYWSLGLYKQSEVHLKRAMEIQQAKLGSEDPATLLSMHYLGWLYFSMSRYSEAEQLLTHAMEARSRVLGEEEGDTLLSMVGLACVYHRQGRFQEAENLIQKALGVTLSVPDHPYTPAFMNALARNYELQGRFNEAEQIIKQGLEIGHRVLNENDWFMLLLKHSLSRICWHLGRYEEAEEPLMETLKGRREAWGQEHPDTLGTIATLGQLYHTQGRYVEAELYLDQALENSLQVLGDAHFLTVECMRERGILYLRQGKYDKAEPMLEKALKISNRIAGEKNWSSLSVKNAVGNLFAAQGRYNEAEKSFRQVIETRVDKLGADHPDTLESKNDLAVLYKEQAHFKEAEPLLLEAVEGRRFKLGDAHPHTLESLNTLIDLYEASGKPEKAKEWRVKLP